MTKKPVSITPEAASTLEKVHREIQEKQNFLDNIIYHLPLAVFAKKVKQNYSWAIWNRKSEELFDLKIAEVIGKNDYDLFPKEQADWFREMDIKVMESGEAIEIPAEPVTTSRGTWLAHTIKVPIYDQDGNPDILLGILDDITEATSREQKLKEYSETLEKQTEELTKAKNAADRANAAKSQFLANMSHELRTPMHAILNYSQTGLKRLPTADKAQLEKYFTNIHTSGQRLSRLLNNLLDLSKMEAGKMSFHFHPLLINLPLEQAQAELQSLLDSKQLTISYHYDTDNLQADFDRERIIQVIVNLLSNAIKFSPEGTDIKVSVAEHEFEQNGENIPAISVSIADQGIGIPDGELEQVFDKFIQSSKTVSGAGGTGLGLSISMEIIKAHNGKIWAEHGKERGALFIFVIPRQHVVCPI